jgi:Spy/CpxP family protein refolding chaperone
MKRNAITTLFVLAAGSVAGLQAQTPPPAPNPPDAARAPQGQQGPGPGAPGMRGGRMMQGGGMGRRAGAPPLAPGTAVERRLQGGPGGRWWNNPEMAQRIGINAEQQKKMDDIFQSNRLRLVDLNATLRKDEFILEPLLQSETPEESKILAQIDKVAQGRAELEKANARFLLGIRRVLTPDQWKKLQAERPNAGMRGPGRADGPGGPGGGPNGPPPPRR